MQERDGGRSDRIDAISDEMAGVLGGASLLRVAYAHLKSYEARQRKVQSGR